MDYQEALKKVKKLLKNAELGDVKFDETQNRLVFRGDHPTIGFYNEENVRLFIKTVDVLWKADNEIFETYTLETFEKSFIRFLAKAKQDEICSDDTLKAFYRDLRSVEAKTFEILYVVFGAKYYKGHPLTIGPFTLYNPSIHRKHLLDKYPHSELMLSMAFDPDENDEEAKKIEVVVGVSERARESLRASQKAYVHLQQFENTMRFILGREDTEECDIGVFNFNEIKRTRGVLLSDTHATVTSRMKGAFDPILLHKYPINDSQYGHDKLWEMLAKEKLTDLEKRIISAVSWVGKGLRDEEPARAFVQYVFALEALLQIQQDVLVSPSITYSISEMSAFILGHDLKMRLEIEKVAKEVYGKRSAIAHGSSQEVDSLLLKDALWLIKSLITVLITDERFQDFKQIGDIQNWIKTTKYSF
ncbi:hypothetical protein COL23_25755 [Priestia aryabhattai]|uniref:HEPN domain-containing protein n=1 Tax=Priestia aryabhattai TaxID=412384 RepID=UPI000BF414EA|nr:HEPN domain-containing protein [Priestia aryabhattai]PFW72159.1 hypothetical protein COL23_25755 [Priestia aryabhattai]